MAMDLSKVMIVVIDGDGFIQEDNDGDNGLLKVMIVELDGNGFVEDDKCGERWQ